MLDINDKKKILVIRFSAMGDVAMLSSVVKEVLLQNKDIEIDFLSRKLFEPFFDGIENLNFIGVDLNKYKGVFGIFKLYNLLKNNNYKYVVDAHNVLRTILLRILFSLRIKNISYLDKGRSDKKKLIQKIYNFELKHNTERYADVFRKLNINVDLSNKLTKCKREIDISQLFNGRKNIGIAPFAKHKSKEYSIQKMENIINRLSKIYNVFLFGGGNEELKIIENIKIKNEYIYFFKDLGLKGEMDLISNMDIMLTMDSANMHISSLVGTKVISIWGGTHYFSGFLGYGQNKEMIIEKKLKCRPCSIFGNKECSIDKKYDCLDIDEELILDFIEKNI